MHAPNPSPRQSSAAARAGARPTPFSKPLGLSSHWEASPSPCTWSAPISFGPLSSHSCFSLSLSLPHNDAQNGVARTARHSDHRPPGVAAHLRLCASCQRPRREIVWAQDLRGDPSVDRQNPCGTISPHRPMFAATVSSQWR